MPSITLNDISVRSLKAPASGQITVWDSTLKGFGIRISKGGAKSWVVVTGAMRKRTTLARYPEVSLKDARIAAKKGPGSAARPHPLRYPQGGHYPLPKAL
jgi:hypothetical protein